MLIPRQNPKIPPQSLKENLSSMYKKLFLTQTLTFDS